MIFLYRLIFIYAELDIYLTFNIDLGHNTVGNDSIKSEVDQNLTMNDDGVLSNPSDN